MIQQLWKRFDTVEKAYQLTSRQVVTVIQRVGETNADTDEKIDQWKSGETVDGINGKYRGGELDTIVRVIVVPSNVEKTR